jgi:hypothetical protein
MAWSWSGAAEAGRSSPFKSLLVDLGCDPCRLLVRRQDHVHHPSVTVDVAALGCTGRQPSQVGNGYNPAHGTGVACPIESTGVKLRVDDLIRSEIRLSAGRLAHEPSADEWREIERKLRPILAEAPTTIPLRTILGNAKSRRLIGRWKHRHKLDVF